MLGLACYFFEFLSVKEKNREISGQMGQNFFVK